MINLSFFVGEIHLDDRRSIQIISLNFPALRFIEFICEDQSTFYYSDLEWFHEYLENMLKSITPITGAFHGSFASEIVLSQLEDAFDQGRNSNQEMAISACWQNSPMPTLGYFIKQFIPIAP